MGAREDAKYHVERQQFYLSFLNFFVCCIVPYKSSMKTTELLVANFNLKKIYARLPSFKTCYRKSISCNASQQQNALLTFSKKDMILMPHIKIF